MTTITYRIFESSSSCVTIPAAEAVFSNHLPDAMLRALETLPLHHYILCPIYEEPSFEFQVGMTGTCKIGETDIQALVREMGEELALLPRKGLIVDAKRSPYYESTIFVAKIPIDDCVSAEKITVSSAEDEFRKIGCFVHGSKVQLLSFLNSEKFVRLSSTDAVIGLAIVKVEFLLFGENTKIEKTPNSCSSNMNMNSIIEFNLAPKEENPSELTPPLSPSSPIADDVTPSQAPENDDLFSDPEFIKEYNMLTENLEIDETNLQDPAYAAAAREHEQEVRMETLQKQSDAILQELMRAQEEMNAKMKPKIPGIPTGPKLKRSFSVCAVPVCPPPAKEMYDEWKLFVYREGLLQSQLNEWENQGHVLVGSTTQERYDHMCSEKLFEQQSQEMDLWVGQGHGLMGKDHAEQYANMQAQKKQLEQDLREAAARTRQEYMVRRAALNAQRRAEENAKFAKASAEARAAVEADQRLEKALKGSGDRNRASGRCAGRFNTKAKEQAKVKPVAEETIGGRRKQRAEKLKAKLSIQVPERKQEIIVMAPEIESENEQEEPATPIIIPLVEQIQVTPMSLPARPESVSSQPQFHHSLNMAWKDKRQLAVTKQPKVEGAQVEGANSAFAEIQAARAEEARLREQKEGWAEVKTRRRERPSERPSGGPSEPNTPHTPSSQSSQPVRALGYDRLKNPQNHTGVFKHTLFCNGIFGGQGTCRHGAECRFAHSWDQLAKKECAFADQCRYTKCHGKGVYTNVTSSRDPERKCSFWHPEETNASWFTRMGYRAPAQAPAKSTVSQSQPCTPAPRTPSAEPASAQPALAQPAGRPVTQPQTNVQNMPTNVWKRKDSAVSSTPSSVQSLGNLFKAPSTPTMSAPDSKNRKIVIKVKNLADAEKAVNMAVEHGLPYEIQIVG